MLCNKIANKPIKIGSKMAAKLSTMLTYSALFKYVTH